MQSINESPIPLVPAMMTRELTGEQRSPSVASATGAGGENAPLDARPGGDVDLASSLESGGATAAGGGGGRPLYMRPRFFNTCGRKSGIRSSVWGRRQFSGGAVSLGGGDKRHRCVSLPMRHKLVGQREDRAVKSDNH